MGYKYKNPTSEIVDGKRKQTKCYVTWSHMMSRCYNSKFHEIRSTYKDCEVCDEWKDYDIFYNWFQENYKDGFALDKDILVQGNKVYSPSTCCFVPQYINSLFVKSDAKRGYFPLGTTFHKQSNKYQANCKNGQGKKVHLGLFTDPIEAHEAYCAYKYQLIREIASEALKIGVIDERIYNAMINYQIPMY